MCIRQQHPPPLIIRLITLKVDAADLPKLCNGLNEIVCFPLQVKDVRTQDDTMIIVKLMLFYELKDVTKMVCTLS